MNKRHIITDKELLQHIPNVMDDFVKRLVEKESIATIFLYLQTAIRERISIQECILRYEPRKCGDDYPHTIDSYNVMAARIEFNTTIRLVRRAHIELPVDVVNHQVDSVANEFINLLRDKLNLY